MKITSSVKRILPLIQQLIRTLLIYTTDIRHNIRISFMFIAAIDSFHHTAILLLHFYLSFHSFVVIQELLCCHVSQWSHDPWCSTQPDAQSGAQVIKACSSLSSTTSHLHPAVSKGQCDMNFLGSTVLLKLKKREKIQNVNWWNTEESKLSFIFLLIKIRSFIRRRKY